MKDDDITPETLLIYPLYALTKKLYDLAREGNQDDIEITQTPMKLGYMAHEKCISHFGSITYTSSTNHCAHVEDTGIEAIACDIELQYHQAQKLLYIVLNITPELGDTIAEMDCANRPLLKRVQKWYLTPDDLELPIDEEPDFEDLEALAEQPDRIGTSFTFENAVLGAFYQDLAYLVTSGRLENTQDTYEHKVIAGLN